MDYLIDGYNLMFRVQSDKKSSLEKRRETLIELLNTELSFIKTHVSVVFDSSEQVREFAQKANHPSLDVIYAPKGLSADDYIFELVEQRSNAKTLTVVTSDNELAKRCQHLGAHAQTIEAFLAYVTKKRTPKEVDKPRYTQHPQELERLRKIFEERLSDL